MHPQKHFPTNHIQAKKLVIKESMKNHGYKYLTENLLNLCQEFL